MTDFVVSGHIDGKRVLLPLGTIITSRRHGKRGKVVGYGILQWPYDAQRGEGDAAPQPVYLVQLADGPLSFVPGSSSLGPACAVFRADQIEEVQ